ncbi:MAG: PDC sensor domain-containing protein [Armatimonadetes bacterium]|nr:PDC sensor domain-containing protein [Armatimonadota bacterium]
MRKIGIQKAKASGQSSWRWKLCALVACLVILVGTSGICAFYYYARQTLFDEICERPAFFASSIALQINAEELELLRERGDEDTQAYRQTKKLLVRFRAANPEVRRIYILHPSKNLEIWKFLVGTEQDPKLVRHIGDNFDASQLPELREALLRPSSVAKVKHAPWGNWISGYAPILDGSGQLVGVVGVEMSASQLESELAQMRRMGAFFC